MLKVGLKKNRYLPILFFPNRFFHLYNCRCYLPQAFEYRISASHQRSPIEWGMPKFLQRRVGHCTPFLDIALR